MSRWRRVWSMGIQNLSQPHRRPRQARQGHLLWRVGFNCASRTGIIHPGAQKLTSSFMGCTIHKILPEGPRTSEKAMVDLGLRGRGGHALRGSPIAPVQSVEGLQRLPGLGVRRQAKVSPTHRGPARAVVRTPRLTQGRERGKGDKLAAVGVVAGLLTQARRRRPRSGGGRPSIRPPGFGSTRSHGLRGRLPGTATEAGPPAEIW